MSELRIITNGHTRDIIYGWELTDRERTEFDYYTEDELLDTIFFRYKGEVYDLGEFTRIDNSNMIPPQFVGWNGYQSDSFFSGILVKYPDDPYDTEHVIVGWYFS